MPYIKVKVSQDLYQELGLCPSMELVRSDSKGSIKFVPLSDESDFDYYESPRRTSPQYGNHTNIEKVTGKIVPKVLPSEPVSNIATHPSASTNEECIAPTFKNSQTQQDSVNSDTSEQARKVSILREDKVGCTTKKLCEDEDSSKDKPENVTFMERPDINKSVFSVDKAQSNVENNSNQGEVENELIPNKENKIVTPALQLNPIISFPFANPTGYIFVPCPPVNTMPSGVHITVNSETSVSAERGTISNDDVLKRTTDKCSDDAPQNNSCEKTNNSKIIAEDRIDLNQFVSSGDEVRSSLKHQDAVNNQLTCNQGNTILMTSALQVNPIVNFTAIANPSGFIVFPRTPVNTLPAGVHISESSVTSVEAERVARNDDELKIDTAHKVCKDAPQNYPSEDGTKSRDIFSVDDIDLNQSVSSQGDVQFSVDNDSNRGVFEKVLTTDKGNTIITPGVQVNPFISMTSFANPTGYILFPNKSTKADVLQPNLSGSLSSVILSTPQLASEQQKTAPSIAKHVMPLKLPGDESNVSPQNMLSTEVPVSDLPLQNVPVIKGYSAPKKSLVLSDVKCNLLPKPRNWLDRKPAVPTKTFPQKLNLTGATPGGFTPLTDSSSNDKTEGTQPKEDSNELFMYRREEKSTRIKLQCKNCSSFYSSKKTFSNHIGRCDYLREKKLMGDQIPIKYPRKCKKCSVLIFTQGSFSRHLKKCQGVYVHSKNRFIPVESDNVAQSTSLVNNVLSKEEDKYILYKDSESRLLYVKKKV